MATMKTDQKTSLSRWTGHITHALLVLATLCVLVEPSARAAVDLPDGRYAESVEDFRVKVLGGFVAVTRHYADGRWQVNSQWNPIRFTYDNLDGTVKSIDRNGGVYQRSGDAWTFGATVLIRRALVNVLPVAPAGEPVAGIPGQGGQSVTSVQGYRWQDRKGDWIHYDGNGRMVAYGDRNDVTVWLQYDGAGNLKYVLDHFGRIALVYAWSGSHLAQVADNPQMIPGSTAPAHVVQYFYTGSTSTTPAYPLLTRVTDVRGYDTHYSYESGRLKTITDAENRVRTLSYGPTGRISSVKEPDGTETTYVYDYDKSRREFYVRVTGPQAQAGRRIEETWHDEEGIVIRRAVNGRTQLTVLIDTTARTTTRKDAANRPTITETDEFDNVVKTTYPDGSITTAKYSAAHGLMTEQTDALGVKTLYEYDARGNLLRQTEAAGRPEQRVTEYQVEEYGQVKSRTRKGGTVTLPDNSTLTVPDATVSYEYDERGNTVTITDAENHVTRYEYDVAGNLTALTDARNETWRATYDEKGNLLTKTNPLGQSTQYAYNKVGERIEMTDAAGKTTRFHYDVRGRLTGITNALGHTAGRQYDAYGRVTARLDELGKTLQANTYDLDGRLMEIEDANGNATRFAYGEAGELAQIQFPTFRRELAYDARGRVTETTDRLSDTLAYTARQRFDAKGNLVETTDRNGKKTAMAYDGLGRLTQTTDPAGGVTRYAYDARGNLLAVQDANGNVTKYGYERNNRKAAETRPLGQTQRYAYNPAGNLTAFEDAKGNRLAYEYDAAGRRSVERHTPAGTDTPTRTITYHYNAAGALTGYTDSQGNAATYALDELHRKTAETLTYGSLSFTLATTYHATGRKASFTWPDGTVAGYEYDDNQVLSRITLPSGAVSINETRWNAPASLTYPGGTTRTVSYDALMRISEIRVKDPGQVSLLHYRHEYDAESNISAKDTEHGAYGYQYDELYRLTQAANPTPLAAEAYTYDALGNRLTDSNRPGAWEYDGNNALTRSFAATGEANGYTYDANGSLIAKASPSADPKDNQQFVYDAQNRLVEVKDQGGTIVATYHYDPFGRRIAKTVAGTATYYLYADEGLIAEANATGSLTTLYGWRPEGLWGTDPLFIKTTRAGGSAPEIFFYQNDHLGTPQRLIDQAGAVVWEGRAQAFGETRVLGNPLVTNALRFPGQYEDGETGMHQNYFRDYDPGTGRYIQSDPIGLLGAINYYSYAEGNPEKNSDPVGLETCGSGWNEPIVPDNPLGFRFTNCCRSHDSCYDRCGPSRQQCDGDFCRCMRRTCEQYTIPYLRTRCDALATLYCDTVVENGEGPFNNAQKKCFHSGSCSTDASA